MSKSKLSGKSLIDLQNFDDEFDETTFVVKQAGGSSVLPAWAKAVSGFHLVGKEVSGFNLVAKEVSGFSLVD